MAKTGVELIAEERRRQKRSEGWTAKHDDEHDLGELTEAAICYAKTADKQAFGHRPTKEEPPDRWPWDDEWWKPSDDPVRNLVKAGALIAAEIDRVRRLQKKG